MALRDLLRAEIQKKSFTACAYCILKDTEITELEALGRTGEDYLGEEINEETLFDMASVTKPVVVATVMGQLIESGKISLTTKVRDIEEAFRPPDKSEITLGQLLNHTSGLLWWSPLYKDCRSPLEAVRKIGSMQLEYRPGSKEIYSDLGYIALGVILEKLEGARLDEVAHRRVFEPIGMRYTRYLPDAHKYKIVLTEKYANRPWGPGLVHDENCYFLGGITGHAGMFSNILDVSKFARELLRRNEKSFPASAIRMFHDRSNASLGGDHSYGWMFNTGPTTSFGAGFPENSIGHTGYTGTGLWLDLDSGFATILLTNRVFYGREAQRILEVRRSFNNEATKLYLSHRI